MRVGWLGLGAMGAPMAGCLARAGHAVVAYDIVPGRAAALAAGRGAGRGQHHRRRSGTRNSPRSWSPPRTRWTRSSSGQAARPPPWRAGTVVMIMATVGPGVVAEVAAPSRRRGLAVVDAPVSGGVQRAAAGDLLIMVSGADDAVGRARPLLDALARSAPVVGPAPGDGQRMKLVNQLLCGVHIAAAAEALAFAESLGLDPGACWRVLRDGAAASFMFEDRGARMVGGEFDPPRSALDIFVKDMGLVSAAAEHAGASAPLTAVTRRLYQEGHERGLGRKDDAALIEVLRQDGRPAELAGRVL